MKKIIVAKMTHEDESGKKREYIGKRDVDMYDEKTKMSGEVITHANAGLTLRVQNQIRDALRVKYGIKTITSKGEAKDLSAIEEV